MMFVSRVFSRLSRDCSNNCRRFLGISRQQQLPICTSSFSCLQDSSNKWVPSQVVLLHHSIFNTFAPQQFKFSSSASPQSTEKEANHSETGHGTTVEKNGAPTNDETTKMSEDTTAQEQTEDADSEGDLSVDDLTKLVAEKEELLMIKHKEIEKMQDKVLRSYAEMENLMDRTRREAENSKKFAIQNFTKSLLDVADNLGRASSVVKESFSKIDTSNDPAEAVSLLKTLLEGVEMTEKQLVEVFRKFGVEKFDPVNEKFDPHRHNAVFQIPDDSKPPETVAAVLKAGYMLYDRVIRPAEVGVTRASDNTEADQGSGN